MVLIDTANFASHLQDNNQLQPSQNISYTIMHKIITAIMTHDFPPIPSILWVAYY